MLYVYFYTFFLNSDTEVNSEVIPKEQRSETNDIDGRIYFLSCSIFWPPYRFPKEGHQHGGWYTTCCNFLKIISAMKRLRKTLQSYNLDRTMFLTCAVTYLFSLMFKALKRFCKADKKPTIYEQQRVSIAFVAFIFYNFIPRPAICKPSEKFYLFNCWSIVEESLVLLFFTVSKRFLVENNKI